MKRSALQRTPFGAKQKARVQSEAIQATALEGTSKRLGLFSLHHVDWRHIGDPQRDTGSLKDGEPDYFLLGEDWGAWLEIKARNLETKRAGGMRANQYAFHDRLCRAGFEVWTALLPDQLQDVNLWLREKTGIVVDIDGLLAPEGVGT